MYFSRQATLTGMLTGFCALGLAATRPAAAQSLMYTLAGVAFGDGAVATGYFDFNPTSQVFGAYDITTTKGITDTLTGAHYTPNAGFTSGISSTTFIFDNGGSPQNYMTLAAKQVANAPGTYMLAPGTVNSNGGFESSGEFAPFGVSARVITSGKLTVTPVPVPENSSAVSFALLLTLGLVSVVFVRKKGASPAV